MHRIDHLWKRGSEISGTARDGLIFFPLSGLPESRMKHWTEEMGPVDNEVSEGKSIFLGFSYVTFKKKSHKDRFLEVLQTQFPGGRRHITLITTTIFRSATSWGRTKL